MTPSEKKAMKADFRMEMYLKYYQQILEGIASSRTEKVALEIARKLQPRMLLPKSGQAVELVSQSLEDRILAHISDRKEYHKDTVDTIEDLSELECVARTGRCSSREIKMLEKAEETFLHESKILSAEEQTALMSLVLCLDRSRPSLPMTKYQIYFYNKLSFLIFSLLITNRINIDCRVDRILIFYRELMEQVFHTDEISQALGPPIDQASLFLESIEKQPPEK